MKKAIIYLMLVLGVIGLVGCGKDKGEISSKILLLSLQMLYNFYLIKSLNPLLL